MRQVFLDTETTGLGPTDRIVEVACVEMIDRKLTGRVLHHYVNPGRPCHPEAFKIHGIPDTWLAEQKKFSEVSLEILDFINGDEVIAHNASFDQGKLQYEFSLMGQPLSIAITDSLAMARGRYPKQLNNLDALAKRLGVHGRTSELHGALMDAELLAQVYLVMTRSQDALSLTDAEYVSHNAASDSPVSDNGVVIEASEEELAAHAAIMSELSHC